jgi:hypothetical protein
MAEKHGAEIVIMGDFNEKWREQGAIRESATNNARLTNVLQGRSGRRRLHLQKREKAVTS